MEFVNKLPLDYKFKLIDDIEQKQIKKMSSENAERMEQFLEAWKKSDSTFKGNYYADSLLYPVAFNPVIETE